MKIRVNENNVLVAIIYRDTADTEGIPVKNIPDGVELLKWCYTAERGFYENPDYGNHILEEAIISKKKEISTACENAIITGCDVGDEHYSLSLEDQANILAWMAVAQTGKSVPYHCDGKPCRVYSAEEFMQVANTAVAYKTHHTTYCNLLMRQIEEMTDLEEVNSVQYGVTQLNEKYQSQYEDIMKSLTEGE